MGTKRENRIGREQEQDKEEWLKAFKNAIGISGSTYSQRIAGELFAKGYNPRFAAALYLKKYK
jgi:hypothetical protein